MTYEVFHPGAVYVRKRLKTASVSNLVFLLPPSFPHAAPPDAGRAQAAEMSAPAAAMEAQGVVTGEHAGRWMQGHTPGLRREGPAGRQCRHLPRYPFQGNTRHIQQKQSDGC